MDKNSEYRYKHNIEAIEIKFDMEFNEEESKNEQLRDSLARDKLNEITKGQADDYYVDEVFEIG